MARRGRSAGRGSSGGGSGRGRSRSGSRGRGRSQSRSRSWSPSRGRGRAGQRWWPRRGRRTVIDYNPIVTYSNPYGWYDFGWDYSPYGPYGPYGLLADEVIDDVEFYHSTPAPIYSSTWGRQAPWVYSNYGVDPASLASAQYPYPSNPPPSNSAIYPYRTIYPPAYGLPYS